MAERFDRDDNQVTLASAKNVAESLIPWELITPGNWGNAGRGNNRQYDRGMGASPQVQIEVPGVYIPGFIQPGQPGRDVGPGYVPQPSGDFRPNQYDPREVAKALRQGEQLYNQGQPDKALRYLEYAAKAGDTSAQLKLGYMYEKGIGVDQDWEEAAAYYYDAAKLGEPQAMKNLGQLYEYGMGVQENWNDAAYWYEKGARLGNVQAQAALARAYQFGVGVEQNRDRAIYWNNVAASNGDAEAAQWARKLSFRTNFIGFRSDQEQDMVVGNRLPVGAAFIGGDPEVKFNNSEERLAWMRNFAATAQQEQSRSTSPRFQPYPGYYGPGTGRNRE
ncbi:MAG: sel1 repeat family protein [Candidatus Obscuribacterales bacterium]|nr:sel1 repeat family protein [Candidatus Obscuribacterales bacterium]